MEERFFFRLSNIIITLIFCSAIFIPLMTWMFKQDIEISKVEKRKLTQLPGLPKTLDDIRVFPQLFNDYYSDQFGLREWLNKRYKLVKFSIGDSASEDVTIGKNGWLFLGGIKKNYKKYNDPIGDARNINLYSQQDLKKFASYMMGVKAWLKERGIEYVFVIAPNKHTIYFDQLPNYITRVNTRSATDQIFDYLKQNTDITAVDLRAVLMKEKDKHLLYYKTGTHWNFWGGNFAQFEIMRKIQPFFPKKINPELYIHDIFKYDVATDNGLDKIILNKNKVLAPYPVFEPNGTPVNDYTKNADGKDLARVTHSFYNSEQSLNTIVFRDSFFKVLEPYFHRKFKNSTYIWKKLNFSDLTKYIKLKKPDLIIEEWVERKLPYLPRGHRDFTTSLHKALFDKSIKQVYSINKGYLKLNKGLKAIDKKDDYWHLIAMNKHPVIEFPPLILKPNRKYIVHINLTSSVNSTLQIFYSDVNNTDKSLSQKHSVHSVIKQGNNDIYILLDHPHLSPYLRLEPISTPGEITIKALEIKLVEIP